MFVPSWCRWQVDNPPKFTIWHNILFACAGGVYAANLYYSHPILEVMAESFGTGQTGVVNIPTLAQAGDGLGLLLIMPLADFFPRRTFTITILTLTTLFWLGLCLTKSLVIFQVLTFFSAMFTGVHQVFIVLVAELSEPDKRAFNIGIVGMGPTMSILLARILSGIVANYIAWRWIYWISLAMQITVLLALFTFLPNYPTINHLPPAKLAKKYPQILADIVLLLVRHARLIQAGILAFLTFFCVSSYWTTLTFLLSANPYNYSTLIIGLFGLVGAATMVLGPVFGKYVVQPLGIPLCSAMIGVTTSLVGIILGTALGSKYVAGPLLQALLLDAGLMLLFISVRTSIHGIAPGKENRVNTAFAICLYLGGLSGTKAGNDVYAISGGTRGWIASGCLSIAIMATSYLVILARGPHETRWIGWRGGWGRQSTRAKDQVVEKIEGASNIGVLQADLEKGPGANGLQTVVVDVADAATISEPPRAKVPSEKQ